jgi:hypothetical protein
MPRGDFDIGCIFTGGARSNPYFSFDWMLNGNRFVVEEHNLPLEYEAPMPVGDPEGSLGTVDFDEQLERVATNLHGSRAAREAYATMAWAWNYNMPAYPLNRNWGLGYLDANEWIAPDPEDIGQYFPLYAMANLGQLKARGD